MLGALWLVTALQTQTTSARLLGDARGAIDRRQLAQAGPLLDSALTTATNSRDSINALFWTSAWHHLSGRDSLARASARGVFAISPDITFYGATNVSSSFVAMLEQERHADNDPNPAYLSGNVEVAPSRVSGPPVAYPLDAWRRQVKGRAVIEGVVDTTGKLEPDAVEIIEVPDSQLIEPFREAMLAAQFTPGRIKGKPVRTWTRLGMMLQPGPPPNPTDLVRKARGQIAAHDAERALALLDFAEDPLVRPTPGVVAYAKLVRGLALQSLGRDSLANVAFDAGVAGVADLTRKGVDLAPSVRQLADSIRRSRSAAPRSPAGTPTTSESVDQQPAILTFPPIEYPAEMRTLGVGGTVIVEIAVDSTGRPVPESARVVQTPNPGLNAAALKAVGAATYRPARRGGRPIRVVLRQPVTFFQ